MDWEKDETEEKISGREMEEEAALPGGQDRKRRPAGSGSGPSVRQESRGSRYREKRPAAPEKKKDGVDVVKLSLIGLGAVAVIAYVIVAFYFGGHFYSGARIYGIDCGRMTAGQVKEEVEKKLGGIHPDRRGAKRTEGCDYG